MTLVVFVLAPQVHLLDVAGPAQVFASAADLGATYDLHFVGTRARVASHQGLPLDVATSWPALTTDDLVLVPGWKIPDRPDWRQPVDWTQLQRLIQHHDAGGTVGSICAGAFALGAAGLLDGRLSTTHHEVQDLLQHRYPATRVLRDRLFVEDDRVVTSAGIASGIDLALDLVAGRDGPALAARVARTMVVYGRRNGQAEQLGAMLRCRDHLRETVHRAQDFIDAQFDQKLPLAQVAAVCGVSERTLTRAFVEATGLTPLRYQQLLRCEKAELLVTQGATRESAAQAVGFDDARMLRRLRAGTRTRPSSTC
ncbi:GlxA family transcriptional regulator [Flexivirga oryzae]|uniref:Transcriptional regulator GlxA family with amidase domain n=1 Tax=Flexivirga oryzae TaxID=1794944 RepID=A0A839N381_9MICO|nr:DJ-1/PfpI family protein [Flexivirga oryzae]MBB2891249.1 transcriptional regulator GlxA family with amidase domain [Flexivirga oryzae]